MKKYLLKLQIDVADEDDATLLTVVDEDTLAKIKTSNVVATMFQCDVDPVPFNRLSNYNTVEITEITDEEYEVLKKLNIFTHGGCIYFSDEDGNDIELPDWKSL